MGATCGAAVSCGSLVSLARRREAGAGSGEPAARGRFRGPRSGQSRREELAAWVATLGRSRRAEEGLVGKGL